jgi:hypothetical protein
MSRRGYADGYLTIREHGSSSLVEVDTATCKHCQFLVMLNRRDGVKVEPPGYCLQCVGVICSKCVATGECTPFMRQVEEMEARGRLRRSMGVG